MSISACSAIYKSHVTAAGLYTYTCTCIIDDVVALKCQLKVFSSLTWFWFCYRSRSQIPFMP